MKVVEITVKFHVQTKEQQDAILSLLNVGRSNEGVQVDQRVKSAGPVAYTPSSDRTKRAAEALSQCKRVSVLRLAVLETWANAYPHVDLAAEIAKAEAWAESKDVKRTARGWQKALNSWLSKAQDNTRGNSYNHTQAPKVAVPVAPESETKAWIEAAS